VDDYYGFVIRRLAAAGTLPAHYTADVPSAPRQAASGAPAGPSGLVSAPSTASEALQTQVE
jgi:hypothetical protein